jgi:hypothetical protein
VTKIIAIQNNNESVSYNGLKTTKVKVLWEKTFILLGYESKETMKRKTTGVLIIK